MVTLKTKAIETVAPQRIKMSYEQYLDFADDSRIVDWVDGEAILYRPPATEHQDFISFLTALCRDFVDYFGLGKVLASPYEVKLWPDGPSREPDLIFISKDRLSQLTGKRFEGAPDLVVEAISPSSITEDRVRKFTEYERAGVREYWIIDPRPHQQQVDFFALGEDGEFDSIPLTEDGIFHSAVLPQFWLDSRWFQTSTPPNAQRTLAQIMLSIDTLPDNVKQAYQTIYQHLT